MGFPFLRQYDAMDCGPTCLAMICKYYGKRISVQRVREKCQLGKQGISLLGLSDAAEALGFETHAVQLTYEQLLAEVQLPCILHWSQTHFVVLTKVNKKSIFRSKVGVEIADPADRSLVRVDEATFKKNWISNTVENREVGIALLLEPKAAFHKLESEKSLGKGKSLFNVFNYLLQHRSLVAQLLFSLTLTALFQMLLPFLTQSVVDTGIRTNDLHFIYIILLAQIALFSGRLTLDFVRGWMLLHISTRINLTLLTGFLIKLMKLPISYFDSKQTGDLLQRMSDHRRIESFLTGSSLNVLFSLVNLLVFSGVLAFYSSIVFVVSIGATIAYVGWIFIFLERRKELDFKKFTISAQEHSTKIQMIQGMQEIKLHGCARKIRWNWEDIQARLFKLNVKSLSLDQWQQSGALFINEGKNILITFFCAKAVIDGQMTLGTMLAVQYIIGQLNTPVEQMLDFVKGWQDTMISLARLDEIHHVEDEEPANKHFIKTIPTISAIQLTRGETHTKNFQTSNTNELIPNEKNEARLMATGLRSVFPSIYFHQVTFTYSGAGNSRVLRNVSMTIPSGKVTAIVGLSGSGKTTLLKLLLKFYEPQLGEIRLGESSLNDISHASWRKHCGVVMQDSYIFSDTIAGNIAVGVDTVDMDRLKYAVNVANIEEFIQTLPLGYQTKIGSDGSGLSMGQRQRILIARAVYRDPEYIFLDEATNSLDANNESVIIGNLRHFFRGKTVVVVAHRLSTVKEADQIIVLNGGQIAECGTHQELVTLGGKYFMLIKNQLELGG
jgi:ATP-binding cassette, subfamily B, bacterial